MLVALGMGLVFLTVTGPWLVRNYTVSHGVLGLAQYSVLERTGVAPGDRLQRTLDPGTMHVAAKVIANKVLTTA